MSKTGNKKKDDDVEDEIQVETSHQIREQASPADIESDFDIK